MSVTDLSHPLEQISERGFLPKCPLPGPVDPPLVGGASFWAKQNLAACDVGASVLASSLSTVIDDGRLGTREGVMSDLFALAMPWWEFVLRAVIVYVVVLLMVRVAGKRTLGQFTPFDMLLLVLLGNAVQNALLGQDTSLGGGLLLAATLIALNYFVGWITTRSPVAERVIEGEPVVLARHGHVLQKVLRRELVSKADFAKAMRDAGCDEVDEVDLALLETNGHITIILKKAQR